MATHNISTAKKNCSKCDKSSGAFSCDGCQQSFCLKHVTEHRQELVAEISIIEQEHDVFHHDLLIQQEKHNEHIIFNQINQWEQESIRRIAQVAKDVRCELQIMLDNIVEFGIDSLNKISTEIHHARDKDDFLEQDLALWRQKISKLRTEIESMSSNIHMTSDNSNPGIQFIAIDRTYTRRKSTANPSNRFTWFNDIKSFINDIADKSSSNVKKDTKILPIETPIKGSIKIAEVNNIDRFIEIQHDGSNNNDQDMTGWMVGRDIDRESKFIYKFPDHFILKCRSSVRISSAAKPNETQENVEEILVYEDTKFWSTGSHIVTYLVDNNDDERDKSIQTTSSS